MNSLHAQALDLCNQPNEAVKPLWIHRYNVSFGLRMLNCHWQVCYCILPHILRSVIHCHSVCYSVYVPLYVFLPAADVVGFNLESGQELAFGSFGCLPEGDLLCIATAQQPVAMQSPTSTSTACIWPGQQSQLVVVSGRVLCCRLGTYQMMLEVPQQPLYALCSWWKVCTAHCLALALINLTGGEPVPQLDFLPDRQNVKLP